MRHELPPPKVVLHPSMQLDTTAELRAPCAVLRDDYMLPQAMSADELARRSGIPAWQVRRLLDGAPIYAEEALRLAAALKTSAIYWLLLQARHDLEKALRENPPGVLPR
ncbi:helix-turn-helix transcriptional regulator [Dyella telluris]|uniref:Addiction module antidote protein, HigA family n=1 Tax=Dyella telluris TaxID=2763498 RepID=A0A7G8Q5T3_9GAMM|nr:addiction module antidote protein, HigA family [Dyella telluris]QNK02141.1 addiction module antidote protein, HigA family [Dyella telluris]